MKTFNEITVSVPGRICLFGEHQDYLNLPVIAAAINRRITVTAQKRNDSIMHFHLPDIHDEDFFSLSKHVQYIKERDYLRSAVNIVQRYGYTINQGADFTVTGTIPINSGTASSTALVAALTDMIIRINEKNEHVPPEEIAKLAHLAEVVEFGEPGGMMDHYSTALGGVIFLSMYPELNIEKLHPDLGLFVLGDSGEPKDTQDVLTRVKKRIEKIVSQLSDLYEKFSLQTVTCKEVDTFKINLEKDQIDILTATLKNRDITREAKNLCTAESLNHKKFGELLYKHHMILSKELQISTPKIDRMIESALKAGAYGAKINGSGGGGCMFAYAPDNTDQVAEAIEKEGGECYIISVDEGLRVGG